MLRGILEPMAGAQKSNFQRGVALKFEVMEAVMSSLAIGDQVFLKRYVEVRSVVTAADELGLCQRKRDAAVRRIRLAFGGLWLCHIADHYRVHQNACYERSDPKADLRLKIKGLLKSDLPDSGGRLLPKRSQQWAKALGQSTMAVHAVAGDDTRSDGKAFPSVLLEMGAGRASWRRIEEASSNRLIHCSDVFKEEV